MEECGRNPKPRYMTVWGEGCGIQWPRGRAPGSWHCCQDPVAGSSWLLDSSGRTMRQVTGYSSAGLGISVLCGKSVWCWKDLRSGYGVHGCVPPCLGHWAVCCCIGRPSAQWVVQGKARFGSGLRDKGSEPGRGWFCISSVRLLMCEAQQLGCGCEVEDPALGSSGQRVGSSGVMVRTQGQGSGIWVLGSSGLGWGIRIHRSGH